MLDMHSNNRLRKTQDSTLHKPLMAIYLCEIAKLKCTVDELILRYGWSAQRKIRNERNVPD